MVDVLTEICTEFRGPENDLPPGTQSLLAAI